MDSNIPVQPTQSIIPVQNPMPQTPIIQTEQAQQQANQIPPSSKKIILINLSKIIFLMLIFLFLIISVIVSIYFFAKNKNTTVKLNPTPIATNNVSTNKPLLLFNYTKERLIGFQWSTREKVSSFTYLSPIDSNFKQAIDIGNVYIGADKQKKYYFKTSKNGNYLLRISNSSIEIASNSNPQSFKTLFTCNYCKTEGSASYPVYPYVIFSEDESEIAYIITTAASEDKLFISDLNGNKIETKINGSGNLVAFNSKDKKIAIGAFGTNSSMLPQIITYDSNGNVIKREMSNNWDFLDQFSNDFKYVYAEGYTAKGTSILRYDLEKGTTEKLFEISESYYGPHPYLSPDGNKITFMVGGIETGPSYLYVLNLYDNSYIKKEIKGSYKLSQTNNVWSSDDRYIYLTGNCESQTCSRALNETAYYFDTKTQEIKLFYKTIGNSLQENDNLYHEIENLEFIGWLNSNNKQEELKQTDNYPKQKLATFTPSLLPSATPIPTISNANWKTYNSTGISFKYPENYTVTQPKPNVFNIALNGTFDQIGIDASLSNGLENYQTAINSYKKIGTDISQTNYKNGTKIIANLQGIMVRAVFLPYKNGAIVILTYSPNISDAIFDQFISEVILSP